jgi:hypothetical protein
MCSAPYVEHVTMCSALYLISEGYVSRKLGKSIRLRFASLGNFNDSKDMHRAWENIKENIKTQRGSRSVRTEAA